MSERAARLREMARQVDSVTAHADIDVESIYFRGATKVASEICPGICNPLEVMKTWMNLAIRGGIDPVVHAERLPWR